MEACPACRDAGDGRGRFSAGGIRGGSSRRASARGFARNSARGFRKMARTGIPFRKVRRELRPRVPRRVVVRSDPVDAEERTRGPQDAGGSEEFGRGFTTGRLRGEGGCRFGKRAQQARKAVQAGIRLRAFDEVLYVEAFRTGGRSAGIHPFGEGFTGGPPGEGFAGGALPRRFENRNGIPCPGGLGHGIRMEDDRKQQQAQAGKKGMSESVQADGFSSQI